MTGLERTKLPEPSVEPFWSHRAQIVANDVHLDETIAYTEL
jgi:hypothetical protein